MGQPVAECPPPRPARAACVVSARSGLRPPPESGHGAPLTVCITTCSESHEELQYCLETFHGQCPADLNLDMIYVFLDGCPDEDMQATNPTFQALVSILGVHVAVGDSVVIHEGGCRVYLGKVGGLQARLYVKGRGDFQRSKRRSIIAFYDILGERVTSGKSDEPLAILHMDADTGSAESGRANSETSFGLQNVAKLVRILKDSDKIGALATQVRVLHRTRNALALIQSFDCNSTYVGINGGTSLVGRSIACLGMTVMYRYRALHVSTVKGVLPPLSAFSRTADRSIVDHVNLDMNEDQGMTTFIMRAGHDTKTSLITPFYTFAPENLVELLGQRRRWQVGFLVGLPYQMFGLPSPHLQLSKLRWLVPLLMLTLYVNQLLMPGTLGFGLAFAFEQVYVELVLEDEVAGSYPRQAVFASCIWAFWLAFMISTLGHAPKKVRGRCNVFFTVSCVATVACAAAVAALFPTGQALVGVTVVWNAAVGVLLTHDAREWPHRLQEVLLYIVFICCIKPMITMYAVANIDSSLWGTRSIGDVKSTSSSATTEDSIDTDTDTDTDTGTGDISVTEVTPLLRAVGGGDRGRGGGDFAPTRGNASAPEVDQEEAVSHTHPDSDAFRAFSSRGCREEADASVAEVKRGRKGVGGGEKRAWLSLRAWKFIILVPWVLVNIGVTAMYLTWCLYTVALVGFFLQIAGMVAFVAAAWVEMQLQRRSAIPPSLRSPLADLRLPKAP